MKNLRKLNLLLIATVCLLSFLLIKPLINSNNIDSNKESSELASDFTNFRIHNIHYHLEALEAFQKANSIEEVKKQLETTMLSLFVQYSFSGDIDNEELSQASLKTLCRLHLYNREDKFEKEISSQFSEVVNRFYIENSNSLRELYISNQIDSETCMSATSTLMPNFKKLDSQIQSQGESTN